jgi:hypothetical protein
MNHKTKTMKKLMLILAAACLLISCQKKDADPVITEQEVVFSAMEIFPDAALKSSDFWECKDLSIDYAKVKIGDDFYYTDVYRINGILYTQALRLDVPPIGNKTYTINEFFLMHDNGVKDMYPDLEDEIVMATPTEDGEYKEYVTDPVALDFTVYGFEKTEIPIDVLCFNSVDIENFGFEWFQITEIIIREQCFFGDICLNGVYPEPNILNDYVGSMYDADQLPPGVQIDMPAIFKIHSFKTYDGITEELPGSPKTNATVEYGYGAGFALCVNYPDQVTLNGEIFTFDLWVWVKNSAGGFSYQYYDTYTCIDGGPITKGDPAVPAMGPEGIVDFAIGNCSPWSTNIYNWLASPPPKK